jgi:hypothetical protein
MERKWSINPLLNSLSDYGAFFQAFDSSLIKVRYFLVKNNSRTSSITLEANAGFQEALYQSQGSMKMLHSLWVGCGYGELPGQCGVARAQKACKPLEQKDLEIGNSLPF